MTHRTPLYRETVAAGEYPKWDYKDYPKSLPPDDLWGQVRRTVYGKPVTEDQIQMIVDAVERGLRPSQSDYILDIGCGNGALTARFFDSCDRWLGVDPSEYLISIAQQRFNRRSVAFACFDAVTYAKTETDPTRFSKALCYGVFAYLSDSDVCHLLQLLHDRFVNLNLFFIGSLPDPDRAARFFGESGVASTDLNSPQTQIGVWRSRKRIDQLAGDAGWSVRFRTMPDEFYQAHYRYNAILERA